MKDSIDFKKVRNVLIYGDKHNPNYCEKLMNSYTNKVVMFWNEDVTKIIRSLKFEVKTRLEMIFANDCNDFYECEKKDPNYIKPLVVFIKHSDSGVLYDPSFAYLVFRGYNAGVYFVFCFDEIKEYDGEGTLMTCGKKVFLYKKDDMDDIEVGKDSFKIFQNKKNKCLKCLRKLTDKNVYLSYYVSESYLKDLFTKKQKDFFYTVDPDSEITLVKDLFED